jgi:hypothetical protein
MSEPAICSACNHRRPCSQTRAGFCSSGETEKTELVNAWFQSRARTDGDPVAKRIRYGEAARSPGNGLRTTFWTLTAELQIRPHADMVGGPTLEALGCLRL